MNAFRVGTIALVILSGVAVAGAQPAPSTAPAPGAPGGMTQKLDLTAEQRTAIYREVSREKSKVKVVPNVRANVGALLPASMELYTLPDGIMAQVPATREYKYTIVQNEVVIVDPTSMRVVDIIRQ